MVTFERLANVESNGCFGEMILVWLMEPPFQCAPSLSPQRTSFCPFHCILIIFLSDLKSYFTLCHVLLVVRFRRPLIPKQKSLSSKCKAQFAIIKKEHSLYPDAIVIPIRVNPLYNKLHLCALHGPMLPHYLAWCKQDIHSQLNLLLPWLFTMSEGTIPRVLVL